VSDVKPRAASPYIGLTPQALYAVLRPSNKDDGHGHLFSPALPQRGSRP
jgi:hypothetical protein